MYRNEYYGDISLTHLWNIKTKFNCKVLKHANVHPV